MKPSIKSFLRWRHLQLWSTNAMSIPYHNKKTHWNGCDLPLLPIDALTSWKKWGAITRQHQHQLPHDDHDHWLNAKTPSTTEAGASHIHEQIVAITETDFPSWNIRDSTNIITTLHNDSLHSSTTPLQNTHENLDEDKKFHSTLHRN